MIRFTYNGVDTDQDIPPDIRSVASTAADIAEWALAVSVQATQTSATTWTITAQGESVTAEVIES